MLVLPRWVRVRLHCPCMATEYAHPERSWHQSEVEELTEEEAKELIEQHRRECKNVR